jgi:hypothetical protein
MQPPRYRFLPWARRGLAQGVANPDAATLPARTSIQVNLDVAGKPASSRVDLYGPGEVTAIDRRLILRTDPRPGATDFEPNYLAAIELDPPDFPWLFTPAAHRNDRLRPWCVLVAVKKQPGVTMSVRADLPLPVLSIASPAAAAQELPNLADSWAWAHTQLLERPGTAADLDAEPDRNLSRLVCPRRLEPETRYLACVVPAFDLGVARGLGQPVTGAQVRPAWTPETVATVAAGGLPVYYFWEFATSVEDDIESMARRLHGPEHAPENLGRRRIYAAAGHPRLAQPPLAPAARTVTMAGALRPAEAAATPDPEQAPKLTERLAAIVARRHTAELPAPLYGEWPAAQHELEGAPTWMTELNTTVAHRIAAGLGAEVVRRNQEAFVQAAWQQVGQVRQANELAQRARLAAAVLGRMLVRHFAQRPPDRLLQLAGPALAATSVAPAAAGTALRTMAAALEDASLPAGAATAPYRRLASGQRQAVKRAVGRAGLVHRAGLLALTAANPALVEPNPGPPDGVTGLRDLGRLQPAPGSGRVSLAPLGLEGETSAAELDRLAPVPGPVGSLPTSNLQSLPFFPHAELPAVFFAVTGRPARPQPGIPPITRQPQRVTDPGQIHEFGQALAATARAANRATPVAEFMGADVGGLGDRLLARLDPGVNVARRVASMVSGPGAAGADGFHPYAGVQAFPQIGDSTYQYLDRLPGGWVLPEANGLEPDTAILLRTNPEFIAAFLVGLNHEMNGELLWRGYPTDRRGTPFQHFWDRDDGRREIVPIHRWRRSGPLGTAGAPPVPGGGGGDGDVGGLQPDRQQDQGDDQIVLLLRGTLLRRYPDLVVYAVQGSRTEPDTDHEAPPAGRPMFAAQLEPDITLVGFPLTAHQFAGDDWWFVLEQQLTAPRFGFDADDPHAPTPASWADATWSMVGIDPGQHIRATTGKITTLTFPAGPGGRPFGSTADQIAISLLQRPIRVAMHKDRLLLHPGGGA